MRRDEPSRDDSEKDIPLIVGSDMASGGNARINGGRGSRDRRGVGKRQRIEKRQYGIVPCLILGVNDRHLAEITITGCTISNES